MSPEGLPLCRVCGAWRDRGRERPEAREGAGGAARDICATPCVRCRGDSELGAVSRDGHNGTDHLAADLFGRRSLRHVREALRGLGDNDDRALLATADAVLGPGGATSRNGA